MRLLAPVCTASSLACDSAGAPTPRLVVSPAWASVATGDSLVFQARPVLREGAGEGTAPISEVSFAATGGRMTGVATYIAGDRPGSYRVIATSDIGTDTADITVTPRTAHNYATRFERDQDPLRDGGLWIDGASVGLDWARVSTSHGRAIGHQVGPSGSDATAVLTGSWGTNQRVAARVVIDSGKSDCFQELELRLRSELRAHFNRGYEVSFKASNGHDAYLIIVRWNGPLGDYTYLLNESGSQYGVSTGDVIAASIVGDVITAYRNGRAVGTARDAVIAKGNPGLGFNLLSRNPGCSGTNADYGFLRYTATDFVTR